MRKEQAFLLLLCVCVRSHAVIAAAKPESATVPIAFDHNRIIVKVEVYLPDGKMKRVNAWIDNGTATTSLTKKLASELGLKPIKSTNPHDGPRVESPGKVMIGAMQVNLGLPAEVEDSRTVASGVDAEISLSATDLHNYDIVVNYPYKRFTIAIPGKIRLPGKPVKGFFNPQNYLIQLPAKVDNQDFNLALDLGTPISFVSADLIKKWSVHHPSYSTTKGAIGVANLWGLDDEPEWQQLRLPKIIFGNQLVPGPIIVSFPTNRLNYFKKRAGTATEGLFGAASLLNYSISIDYRNKTVYFEKIGLPPPSGMDLVGITLRPEADGSYTILGIAYKNRQPVVGGIKKGDVLKRVDNKNVKGLTMGCVWALLRGTPGDVKLLTIERKGLQLNIKAKVERFLAPGS